ncbi:MAG: hypothetical protein QW478_03040 [Candidatus Micrarchaeaceae archaeon]
MEIRDFLFANNKEGLFYFEVKSKENAVVAGIDNIKNFLEKIKVDFLINNLESVQSGTCILKGSAKPLEIINLEENILGIISKISGVATAAKLALDLSNGQIKVVCGAWKKINPEIRNITRKTVQDLGLATRITEPPFVYLDKNYIKMLGGIKTAVKKAKLLNNHKIVVQLHNSENIKKEAVEAIKEKADILMVDTGVINDIESVIDIIKQSGEKNIQSAYSGGVTLNQIPDLIKLGVNIVDIGRSIIDAPMVDFSLDVCL